MSVKLMGAVWDSALPRPEKYVALAYADRGDHGGRSIHPSIALVSWQTGYDERQVQRLTRKLEERGVLVPDGVGPRGTNQWRMDVSKLPQRRPWAEEREARKTARQEGDTAPPMTKQTGGGDISPPASAPTGVTPASPEPSHEPSEEPSSCDDTSLAEQAAGETFRQMFPGPETRGPVPGRTQEDIVAGNLAAAQRYEGRQTSEPWRAYPWRGAKPVGEVSEDTILRAAWLLDELTGLRAPEGKKAADWRAGLAEMLQAAGFDWGVMESGVRAAWSRKHRYRPGRPDNFVDEVRKAAAVKRKGASHGQARGHVVGDDEGEQAAADGGTAGLVAAALRSRRV